MLTFGHGTLDRAALAALVTGAAIELVTDVRRFPGSRANEAAARGEVPELMAEIGVLYRWDERLGGRRSLTAAEDASSPDKWWEVKAFRAYAAWTRTPEFRAGFGELVEVSASCAAPSIMCSESVWWRCHRRMISDLLVLERGIEVEHLMHDGRLVEHKVSAGARLGADGRVVWDRVVE